MASCKSANSNPAFPGSTSLIEDLYLSNRGPVLGIYGQGNDCITIFNDDGTLRPGTGVYRFVNQNGVLGAFPAPPNGINGR